MAWILVDEEINITLNNPLDPADGATVQRLGYFRNGALETYAWAAPLDITDGVDSGDLASTVTDLLAALNA